MIIGDVILFKLFCRGELFLIIMNNVMAGGYTRTFLIKKIVRMRLLNSRVISVHKLRV